MDKNSTCIFLNPLFISAVDISPLPLSNLENSSLISLSGFLLDLMLSSTICVWGVRGIGVLCQKEYRYQRVHRSQCTCLGHLECSTEHTTLKSNKQQYCAEQHYTMLCYTILHRDGLHSTLLYCTLFHYTVLYCTALYYIVLYCTALTAARSLSPARTSGGLKDRRKSS